MEYNETVAKRKLLCCIFLQSQTTNVFYALDAVPILQPGEKPVYKVVCKVIKAGSARHAAILTYDEFDKPMIDEEGTSCYE